MINYKKLYKKMHKAKLSTNKFLKDDDFLIPEANDEVNNILNSINPKITKVPHENLWIVTCKGGHVGKNKFYRIFFPIKANTQKDAATKAIWTGRVKHHHPDVILDMPRRVSKEEFEKQVIENGQNPYFKFKNVNEQNRYISDNPEWGKIFLDSLEDDPHTENIKK